MPPLILMLMRHAAVGFGIAALFVALLLAFDVGRLRLLITTSETGALALALLTFFLGLTFGSVQMGFAVMLQGKRRDHD